MKFETELFHSNSKGETRHRLLSRVLISTVIYGRVDVKRPVFSAQQEGMAWRFRLGYTETRMCSHHTLPVSWKNDRVE